MVVARDQKARGVRGGGHLSSAAPREHYSAPRRSVSKPDRLLLVRFGLRVRVCRARIRSLCVRFARELGRKEPTARHAGGQDREAAHELHRTLREMVTSAPRILLLPMLICLQHCVNVNGKAAC